MKTLKLIALLVCLGGAVQAQISIHLDLGTPPRWAPAGHSDVRYYYLPDVEAYYDVPSSMFIYFNGITWVHRSSLPGRFRNYDLYKGYKVQMTDYRGNVPYSHFREHKMKYAKGYRGEPQKNYGERPEPGKHGEGDYSKSRHKQNNARDSRRKLDNSRKRDKGNNQKN